MFYEVIPIKIFKKSAYLEDGFLTYSYSETLKIGAIVLIPLGKSQTIGVIYKKLKTPPNSTFKIKSILYPLFETPLPKYLLESAVWLSKYYLSPLPQSINLFLPHFPLKRTSSLKMNKNITLSSSTNQAIFKRSLSSPHTTLDTKRIPTHPPLNPAQKQALNNLKSIKSPTKLLHGITGSGKTNIYLSLAIEAYTQKKSTILLVPEIALTSQLVQVFRQTFSEHVTLIHSRMTPKTRREIWLKLLHSNHPEIIIGPRSALLSPLNNLGLIIIDEAHEPTYFQDQAPKYHTLRLASFIAKKLQIPCIFGTATPLAVDYYLAKSHNALVSLKTKAKSSVITPNIKIIDLKQRDNFTKNRYFSDQLLQEIHKNLTNHTQTLIYHNRRGSAPITLCEYCGWQALCPNCFLPLTLHNDNYKLICHTCGYQIKNLKSCPNCHHSDIIHKGFGTKFLETELKSLFKTAIIARFDADNEKNQTLDTLYNDVRNGKIDIIIGTQTISRGLDLPHLATVGIIQADSGLSLPDYSSEERTFCLLTQVLGRIGRGHLKTTSAIVQTYHPDNQVITCAVENNYEQFYEYLITSRKKTHLPPFYYLAKVSVTYKTEQTTIKKIKLVYDFLNKIERLYLSAPTPAFHERTTSGYTWQVILKSSDRQIIFDAIQSLRNFTDIRFVLDPPSLL